MKALAVVEPHVAGDTRLEFGHRPVVLEKDVFVFERSPKTLDENVVQRPVHAVHADLDSVLDEYAREYERGKLAALVSIHDRWDAIERDRFFKSGDAELGIQSVRQSPCKDSPRIDIDD